MTQYPIKNSIHDVVDPNPEQPAPNPTKEEILWEIEKLNARSKLETSAEILGIMDILNAQSLRIDALSARLDSHCSDHNAKVTE